MSRPTSHKPINKFFPRITRAEKIMDYILIVLLLLSLTICTRENSQPTTIPQTATTDTTDNSYSGESEKQIETPQVIPVENEADTNSEPTVAKKTTAIERPAANTAIATINHAKATEQVADFQNDKLETITVSDTDNHSESLNEEPSSKEDLAYELVPAIEEVVEEGAGNTETILLVADEDETADAEPDKNNFHMLIAVKTNMLYDAAATPNLGVEIHLGNGWSVGADVIYAWWSKGEKNRFWRISGVEINGRRYFGSEKGGKMSGHHVGIYGQYGSYDLEFGGKGQKSDHSYGAGIDYGYSLNVAKHFNIDFSIGLGYFGGKYEKYKPMDGHYVWRETHRRSWIGPTRAEVSLVWLIGEK